jgi:hypothetical protein
VYRTCVDQQAVLWQAMACFVDLGAAYVPPFEGLAEEVLHLPTEERSKLLDRVVASLDTDRKRDEAWDALTARRDVEIESGQEVAVPGPDLLVRLRAELQ